MKKVKFYLHDRKCNILEKKRLKSFIEKMFYEEKRALRSINFIFCSDNYLLGINKRFLNHDFYTDVITFELSPYGAEVEGEVYISVDRVKENAKKAGVLTYEELHRVIFHGVLHLCGYQDKKKREILKMRSLEEKNLKLYLHETNSLVSRETIFLRGRP